MQKHFQDDLWMGPGTYQIDPKLYKLNRDRLLSRLQEYRGLQQSAIVLQGGNNIPVYDSDFDYFFKQEPFFAWLFGIQEPGCYGVIILEKEKTIGLFPRPDPEMVQWIGSPPCLGVFKSKYNLDNVGFVDQLCDILSKNGCKQVLVLKGTNSDSKLKFPPLNFEGMERFEINTDVLYEEMSDLRVIKSDLEIELLRYVIMASSEAHKEVMLFARPDRYQYECEAEFAHYCFSKAGCRHIAYNCSCPSGKSSAILHYGHALRPNDDIIKDGDICCFDMGASYFGYTADITCSFPANGKFTDDQRLIYEAVLEANMAVRNSIKPGVKWDTMHLLANKVLLIKLKEGGLLQGDYKEMLEADLAYYFQPHGLGHLLGMDVHDVGGYLMCSPPKPEKKAMENLRMARALEKGMVVTIEPGCYFIDFLLEQAVNNCMVKKFLVLDVLERFKDFGGIRIEDDVLVTDTGVEVLNDVPRTVVEIETFMATRKE